MNFKETEVGKIPLDWAIKTVNELIKEKILDNPLDGNHGSIHPKSSDFKKNGIPFIMVSDIKGREVNYDNCKFISLEQANTLKKGFAKNGDVLITHKATIGLSAIVREIETEFIILTPQITYYRVKNHSELDNMFLLYYFKYDAFKRLFENWAGGGSTRLYLGITNQKKLPIVLPPLEEQKAIAKILSDLDSKIEVNNKINKNLEEMAQAIFKQWFIDFEFPCIPENYKFSGAGKPCNPEGVGKPKDFDKVCTYKRVGGLPVPDGDSWFVYILLCEDGSFYKGMTKDLYRRFYEHYTGIGAEWTKTHKPVKVIHYEKFNTQEEARKREEELKSGYGREWVKREYKKYIEGLPVQQINLVNEGLPAHQTRLMMAGEMVESELGMIPNEWKVISLSEIMDYQGGSQPPSSHFTDVYKEGFIRLIQIRDFDNDNHITYIPFTSKLKLSTRKDIMLARYGAALGRVMFGLDGAYNVAIAKILPKKDYFREYIRSYMNTNEFYVALNNKGQRSAQAGFNKSDIDSFRIAFPANDDTVIRNFNKVANTLINTRLSINDENDKLRRLRDTLLPKLMSGEIRVNID